MLNEFIAAHRDEIIARTREAIAHRIAPTSTDTELAFGVPLFLDQLRDRLRTGAASDEREISASASARGRELSATGCTVGQVVHDYGSICQAITALAVELDVPIAGSDFRTLNLCLDVAIADAVTEFARQRENKIAAHNVEQLGFLAHELRNALNVATLAFEAVRSGSVGIVGSTGRLLGKSLNTMSDLVIRALTEVRIEGGAPREELVVVSELLEEIEIVATIQARSCNVRLAAERIEAGLTVIGDSQIISSILVNLVQNACKFTPRHGQVVLSARAIDNRVIIDVADECGGLSATADELFRPYEQRNADRSGLGLGLAISLKGARAIGGDLRVRNVPNFGCVFSFELRRAPATMS